MTAFTTLEDAKKWLRIPSDDAGADDVLTTLVDAASGLLQSMIGRNALISSEVTETRNGNCKTTLLLNEWPVTGVSSLTIDDVAKTLGADFKFSADGGIFLLNGVVFTEGFQNVSITYTAGYSASDWRIKMLKQATHELIALKWDRAAHPGRMSESLGGNIVASYDASDVTPEIRLVVNQLRSVMPRLT